MFVFVAALGVMPWYWDCNVDVFAPLGNFDCENCSATPGCASVVALEVVIVAVGVLDMVFRP